MRVSEPIDSPGYFWLPSNTESPIPGTLRIYHGGKVELEIIGDLSSGDGTPRDLLESNPEQRIYGVVQGHGLVTLDHCRYVSQTFSSLEGAILRARRAFMGAHLTHDEPALFDSIEFSVDRLGEWARKTSPRSGRPPDENPRAVNISYERPEDISFELEDNSTLSILYNYVINSSPQKITLNAQTSIQLTFSEPSDLDTAIHQVHQLQRFLSFAMDKTVYLEYMIGRSRKYTTDYLGHEAREVPIKIFYESLPQPPESAPSAGSGIMLFTLDSIKEDLETVISGWLNNHSIIKPTMNLYFGQKSGAYRYLDGRFLALAQAIETFHRRTLDKPLMPEKKFKAIRSQILDGCPDEYKSRLSPMLLHGNSLSFKERVNELLTLLAQYFGSDKDRNSLAKSIGDTRNYLTHYDLSLEGKALNGQELYDTCLKMEAILQLSFMQLIGFDYRQIDRIIRNSFELNNKLSLTIGS